MIWACSPEFFEHRRQLRKLKPRPAGRLANAWHSFVNFSWYCILNDASTDNVIEQVPDEAAVIDTSHEPSVVTTRSILMAVQASNSSGLQQSYSLRKRRSSSILSSLLPKSSVAPLALPTPSQSSSSPPLSLSSTPPSSVSSSSTTTPSSTPPSSSGNLYRKRLNNTVSTSSTATCGHASTQDEDTLMVQSKKLNTTASNDIETDMRINMARDDHIRQVPGGTIPDTNRLIKRTLDWGMSSASTRSTTPSSVVPTSSTNLARVKQNTNEEDLKDHSQWDESIVNVEVLLGLKKPKNELEAAAQKRELGNETPYWKIDESRDKESAESVSRDVEESRDDGVDSGVESRNVSCTV